MALLAGTELASAQSSEDAPPAVDGQPGPAATSPEDGVRVIEVQTADELWELAATALARGDHALAREGWQVFALQFPRDPRAGLAQRLVAAISPGPLAPGRERALTSQTGRVQLALISAFYGASVGLVLGMEVAAGSHSLDPEAPIWLSVAGTGAGLGLSLGLTRGRYIHPSQANLITAGAVWGYALGLGMVAGFPAWEVCQVDRWGPAPEDSYAWCDVPDRTWRLVPLATSAVAVGSMVALGRRFPDLPAGDIALTNAGGLWGGLTGLWLSMLADANTQHAPPAFMVTGASAGLITGGLLARRLEISRARMQIINLSGGLGLGLAGAVGATADVQDAPAWGGLLIAGQAAGLATGALLTRHREPGTARRADLQLAPTMLAGPDGRSRQGVVLSGRW
jgi:hypothetical protein